ncbi:hypothetical protein M404DRAFT_249113 [Pisolithus tinctorius Marx 270]|uniref:Rap-GAP domain-containing protein n=1 Tax=Pisolithus tinctorius Marx 270 TaxID=870435 RepID=A0A0C3NLT6_PISTI|nr:hypothetical protein M404DRAFT_249113 [Pisolithus tinctorius Marx 270]
MARQLDADNIRVRPRSNTTTFPSFGPWRRPRQETVASSNPPQLHTLSFDALVESLSPPAVPSLTHARALATAIQSLSPLPRPAVLNPVLGSLCTADSPASLQCAAYDIMTAFWERYEDRVSTADKLSYFTLILHSSWSTEVGESRLKALGALTKDGKDVFGMEIPVLNVLKSWLQGAFDVYISCDPYDRAERERSVELLASYVSSMLDNPETAARVSEGDLATILQFYASLVSTALGLPPPVSLGYEGAPVLTPTEQQPPSARPVGASGHRRHPSSLSLRSHSQVNTPTGKHPAELMVTIYLNHLDSQLKSLAPRVLSSILPLLFSVQAYFASPLPRLSVMSGRPLGLTGLEDRIQKTLHSLFAGPYGTTCMMILKRHLSPPPSDQDAANPTWYATSLGAHRTLRNDIRQGLSSKMARAYIARLSSVTYSPSGAPSQMDLERDLMERAWSKDELSGWDLLKLERMLSKSIEAWAKRAASEQLAVLADERDRILDEAAGTLKDIFQELGERDDRVEWDEEEATVTGESLKHLASVVRPLKNADGTPFTIPLSQPNDSPRPFLRTLVSLLAQDHSTYMNPSLSMTLLSIAEHLTDADTAKLPGIMLEQHDLSPASPAWLANWDSILSNETIFSPTRPLTRLEVMKTLQAVYDSLRDLHIYRMALAELVFKFCEREASVEGCVEDFVTGYGCSVMPRILADEVVLRTVTVRQKPSESQMGASLSSASSTRVPDSSSSPSTSTWEMLELLKCIAGEGPREDDDDTVAVNTSTEPQSPAAFSAFSGASSSSVASPILSRRQSEYRNLSSRDSALPSVMSLLSTLAGTSRTQSQVHLQQDQQSQGDAVPPLSQPILSQQQQVLSPLPLSPTEPILSHASFAVIALVTVFSQLVFTPYSLSQANIDVAFSVFTALVEVVTNGKCPRARLTALQFLMRLRADRDHRLYFAEAHYDINGQITKLASVIGRGPDSAGQLSTHGHHQREEERGPLHETPVDELPSRRPRERDERRFSRGRGVGPSQSGSSRSTSRARLPVSPPASATLPQRPARDVLWSVPENLPFIGVEADALSEGAVTYDPDGDSPCVLEVDIYLSALLSVIEKERNWDVLSYVLCHLPVQLANKHFFCGPKCRALIPKLLNVLCSGVTSGELGSYIDRWPPGLKVRDAHGLAYQTLSVLISYRRCLDIPLRHALVDVLREGLNGQPSTILICLRGLTLCAFELTSSLKRTFPPLLEKLSQIMSNPAMAVHILNFLAITGSITELHANLREDDFKMIFGVALQYLQHHNRPGAAPIISWAMSQFVRMISFNVVYVWFLSVKLSDRPRHIPYITRQLLLANEGRAEVDEPTEVCFDWLARYTYASADPRPTNSVLSEIIMNPTNNPSDTASSEPAISEKSWIMGNAIVTIRTLARLGWIEVISRRPSGYTKFLCRLENVPLVGPGDVDPDMISLPAGILAEREETRPHPPIPEDEESRVTSENEDIRGVVEERPGTEGPILPVPDPITGYVWSKTAPSQRRKHVTVDPSFFALQLSPYPDPSPMCKRVIDPSALPSLFRSLERTPVIDTHKVGILYVAPGQTHELEILRNTHGSPAYTRFLEGIGRLINLRGQVDVYAGGLTPDEDGEYAYAWWDDIAQVLYHTATMMPNVPDDEYCVNKKRHIGNDYVRIVWNDSGRPYRFDTLATQFQFVNIVIEPHSQGAIAAFSNFRHSIVPSTQSALANPSLSPPSQLHELENEYFKVTVQRAPGMKDFTPIGNFKLISAEKLPLLVRQLSLLSDRFASMFERTERDEVEVEVITNWRQRLQVVKRFVEKMDESSPNEEGTAAEHAGAEGVMAQEQYRNFTAVY